VSTRPFRFVVMAGLVAGCGPSFRQKVEIVSGADAQRREPDEALRNWYAGYHHCAIDGTGGDSGIGGLDATHACAAANDAKLVAALKAEAAAQPAPDVKAAVETAAACVERVPREAIVFGVNYAFKPPASVKACIDGKRTKVAVQVVAKAEADEAAALEAKGSPDACLDFIEKHPDDKRSAKVVSAVIRLSQKASGTERAAIEERLVALRPATLSELPPERRVLLAGPKGMRAPDVKKMVDAKIASSVIVARIKASREPYRNFDADELVILKEMSLGDDIVTAMIEVTTTLEDQRRADEERKAIRTELDALKKLLDEKKASGATTSGETVQTKEGPMDALASCAKRLGAMKLCEQRPVPASTVCQSTAESSFPCTKQ
jgi:hypothetical protein